MTEWGAAPNRGNEAALSAGQPGGATGRRIPGRVQCVRPPGDPLGQCAPPAALCRSPSQPPTHCLLGDRLSGCE
jgi:hypothetical protein